MTSQTTTLMQNTFGSAAEVWTGEPHLPTPAPKTQTNQRRLASKRLTIDITGELHVRIKVEAAELGTTIGELLRDMLDKRFSTKR